MYQEDIGKFTENFDRYRERITNFSNEFEFGLFVHILKRTLPICILILLSMGISAYLYLRYSEPIYESSAVLQLERSDNATKILNVKTIYDDDQLSAELELLRSKYLIKETVKNLNMNIRYFEQGEILTNEHYTSSFYTIDISSIQDSSILGSPFFIKFLNENKFRLIFRGQEINKDFDINKPSRIDYFDFQLNIDPNFLPWESDDGTRFFFRIDPNDRLANLFYRSLKVNVINTNAKTIMVTCQNSNRSVAKDFVMAHAREYLSYTEKRKEESAEKILSFISSQLDTVESNLKETEYLLNSFKRDNKMADVSNVSAIYLNRYTEFETELLELELQQDLLVEVKRVAESSINEFDIYNVISLLAGSKYEETITNLLSELRSLLLKKEEMFFDVTKENESTRSLDYQISIQRKLILQSIESVQGKLKIQENFINLKKKEIDRDFRTLPMKELEFARYQRLFDINEKFYTILLEKETEYKISKAGFVSDNKILEDAILPTTPISPKYNITYFSFIAFGFVLSLIIIIIRYLLHNDITSLNEIAKLSHASIGVLGLIPKYKKEIPVSQLLVDKNPKSLIAESFRTIRTNLQFIDNTKGSKVLAITSTISGEGKTFVAINLAGIISFAGKKVIVLDLDMRKPKIHIGFGVENSLGMSTLLIGNSTLEHCVQKSDLENLDFITAGPIPPNPSELILSERMNSLLKELREIYDVIIIDNPPVGLVTDGIYAIQHADYPVYIFRADYSKKHFIQNVDRLMNENKIAKLAVILNGVDVERNRYGYYYGYGYGYGYGYAYGRGYGSGYGSGYGYYDEKSAKKPKSWFNRIFKN